MSTIVTGRPSLESQGVLYVVATPIGNLEDITLRAIRILKDVDLIAAEDTRNTRHLLARHGIDCPMISLHEHNEEHRTVGLIAKIQAGMAVALVSDAGTPTLSDPGHRLVREAVAGQIKVVPIPGPSAVIAALSASGLPTDSFLFLGFPPRKRGKRLKFLDSLVTEKRTLVFYESPKRVKDLLVDLLEIMGERQAVLSREMTKRYEEFIRGTLSRITEEVNKRKEIKGECTLLVAGMERREEIPVQVLREAIKQELRRGDTGMWRCRMRLHSSTEYRKAAFMKRHSG